MPLAPLFLTRKLSSPVPTSASSARSIATPTAISLITELPLGKYIVTSSKTGFRTELMRNVEVTLGVVTRANLTLSPGQVKETVDVSADVPLIDTSNVTTGDTIEGEQAANLPVNGRDFTKLLVLVPARPATPAAPPTLPAPSDCSASTAIAAARTTTCSTAPT